VTKWALLFATLLLAGCELQEITIALPDDVVVAEVILQEGDTVQRAWLHRTIGTQNPSRITDAVVTVQDEERGIELEFRADADSLCLSPAPPAGLGGMGTCYVARGGAGMVRAGAQYSLRISMPGRADMYAATRVPGDYDIVTPAAAECVLQPATTMELTWTRSEDAWVYLTQARFVGLLAALRREGVAVPPALPDAPLDLLGLSIGAADTTSLFPADVGVFDRADELLHPVLVAIRDGLPEGVRATVVVAATDRNYVNWIRGGSFNPSGTVRVPSISGGGTGVFGALVRRTRILHVGAPDGAEPGSVVPACT
jgi:hypothetical protein